MQRIRLADQGDERFVGETIGENTEVLVFDPAHAVRIILDIVPNPFLGREIVERLVAALRERGFDDRKLGRLARLITEELRKELDAQRNAAAEEIFRQEVTAGRIQFRLRIDGRNWEMPVEMETTEPESARQLVSRSGGPLQKSLFSPIYENELNKDERDVAVYLDSSAALVWWHRNVARRQYSIQGWKKAKVFPDFIFAVHHNGEARRITVLETKGDQLDNNLDTVYKRELLAFLSSSFAWEQGNASGRTRTGQARRRNRSVCAHPHERVESEAPRLSLAQHREHDCGCERSSVSPIYPVT